MSVESESGEKPVEHVPVLWKTRDGHPAPLLRRAVQRAQGIHNEMLDELALTPVQVYALVCLLEDGQMSKKVLGERIFTELSNLNGLIIRLQQRELIVEVTNPSDRRAKLIDLTDKGRDVARAAQQLSRAAGNLFLERLDEEERAVFLDLLRRLAE